MKIKTRLLMSYLIISVIVASMGFISYLNLQTVDEKIEISNKINQLVSIQENMENILSSTILITDLKTVESLELNFLQENIRFNKIMRLIDESGIQLNDLGTLKDKHADFEILGTEVFMIHTKKLEQQQKFRINYDLEKSQRHIMREPIFATNNGEIIRDMGLIQYYSKETLYQYKDQHHLDEWIEHLHDVQDSIQTKELGFTDEEKNKLSNQFIDYETTARTLGEIAITEREIESLENLKINDLRLINEKIALFSDNITSSIKNDNNDLIQNLLVLSLIIIPVGVLLALSLGYQTSQTISKPIEQLRNVTKKISHGKFNSYIMINGDEEIQNLATDINIMSEQLGRYTDDLRKKERLSAIGKLASRLAHDLRNPLAVIRNNLELMEIENIQKDEKVAKRFDRIKNSISRMSHQLDEVLDFVRTTPLDTEHHSLLNIVRSSVESINVPQNIKIILPENDCDIVCDVGKLEIVLNNLILNAVQAISDKGKIKIRIIERKENVLLEIEDTGSGIASQNLQKIFEPLFTTKQEGTGLGLASCKSIIEKHKGKITVKNNPTTFTITMPKSLELFV